MDKYDDRARVFMKARTKKFDAVAESRKWKEAVAKETEGMTPEWTQANRCLAPRASTRVLADSEDPATEQSACEIDLPIGSP